MGTHHTSCWGCYPRHHQHTPQHPCPGEGAEKWTIGIRISNTQDRCILCTSINLNPKICKLGTFQNPWRHLGRVPYPAAAGRHTWQFNHQQVPTPAAQTHTIDPATNPRVQGLWEDGLDSNQTQLGIQGGAWVRADKGSLHVGFLAGRMALHCLANQHFVLRTRQ
jgi:hypothetical protein